MAKATLKVTVFYKKRHFVDVHK